MATKAKEGAQLKSKSRSAPTTPSSSSQRKRLGPTGTPDKDATASTQEKSIPNYLRPTISSGQNSKHQHSESPSKSPITKKPVEKSASPSSQSKDKARSLKSPLPKPSNSPNSTSEKASSYKNVKTAKAPTATSASSKSSISKGTGSAGATKRKDPKAPPQQVAKVLSVESQPQDEEPKAERSPIYDNAEKKEEESDGNEEKQEKILQHATSEESEAARADDRGKEAMLADSSNEEGKDRKVEGANVALKNEEAKEKGSPTAYNAVIEETASKLAAEKRNKVRALVGAFETVMELEGQQSPQKGDKGKNVGENRHMEEKKADTSRESRYDEEKKAQGGETNQETQQVEISQLNDDGEAAKDGVEDQEQEEKNNVEIEHHIEEQEGKSEEGLTESMWNGENVKEELTESAEEGNNTAKESTEESSNGTGEVMGSEDRKDASPKDSDSSAM